MAETLPVESVARVVVLLSRTPEHDYQQFKCPDCLMPVAHLDNAQVLGMSDIIDFDSRHNVLVGVPHRGRLGQGLGYCKTRYYFTLGEINA